MSETVTVPIDYNEPIADNGGCVGDFLEAEVKRLRKALDEARRAKVSDADTVTVPRWALERVINSAVPPKFWAPRAELEKWAGAVTALKCALDTKAEMPDEPGHGKEPVRYVVLRRGNQDTPKTTEADELLESASEHMELAFRAIRELWHLRSLSLDTKTEMPDEPAKSGPPKGWYPDHSWR